MAPALGILMAGLLLQETGGDFQRQIEQAEKLGLVVPALPEAVAKLDASRIPPELRHRFQTLRARAALLTRLHAKFASSVDRFIDMPDARGTPGRVKVLELKAGGVRVSRMIGEFEYGWADLDAEWAADWVREDVASEPDAVLLVAVWLAAAGRWDAAFREIGETASDHPLIREARRRGAAGLLKQAEAAAERRRWKEAVDRLASAARAGAEDPDLADARQRIHSALVDQAKEYGRKKNASGLEEVLALLREHFQASERTLQELREDHRWISIPDPARFGLPGKDGQPILFNAANAPVDVVRAAGVTGPFDGLAVRIQFHKEPARAHGGPNWDGGALHCWVTRDDTEFRFARHHEKESRWMDMTQTAIPAANAYEFLVLIEKGAYVISVNGKVVAREKTAASEIATPGMQASHGRLSFDRFRLRKKK